MYSNQEGNSSFIIYELKGIVFIEGLVTILAKTEGNLVKYRRYLYKITNSNKILNIIKIINITNIINIITIINIINQI